MRAAFLPLLSLSLLAGTPAHALSCLFGPVDGHPRDGAVDVPTNVVAVVTSLETQGDQVSAQILDADGQVVPARVEVHEQRWEQVLTITPDAPLEPGGVYRLVASTADGPSPVENTFTVGAGPDTAAPSEPLVLSVERIRESTEWGNTDQVFVEVGPPAETVWHEVALIDEGGAVVTGPVRLTDGVETLRFGAGLCDVDADLPDSLEGLRVQVTAVDLAGNRSGQVVEEDIRTRGGCASLPVGGAVGLLGALGLGGLLLRRRRPGRA
jgi:hypothetical protein